MLHEAGNPLGIIRKPSDYAAPGTADRCQKRSVPHFLGSAAAEDTPAEAAAVDSDAGGGALQDDTAAEGAEAAGDSDAGQAAGSGSEEDAADTRQVLADAAARGGGSVRGAKAAVEHLIGAEQFA